MGALGISHSAASAASAVASSDLVRKETPSGILAFQRRGWSRHHSSGR